MGRPADLGVRRKNCFWQRESKWSAVGTDGLCAHYGATSDRYPVRRRIKPESSLRGLLVGAAYQSPTSAKISEKNDVDVNQPLIRIPPSDCHE